MGDGEENLVEKDKDKKVGWVGKKKESLARAKRKSGKLKAFFSHFGLFSALIIYLGIGALIFQKLESPYELERKTYLKNLLIDARRNFTETIISFALSQNASDLSQNVSDFNATFHTALENYLETIDQVRSRGVSILKLEIKPDWDYIRSAFFACTVVSTIGYGDMAPKTFWGRLFCICFAMIGIPFTLTVIADLGKLIASGVASTYKRCRSQFPREIINSSSKLGKALAGKRKFATAWLALCSLLLYIALGGWFFTFWETWSFFDSFYFCFITMTTIGFGDLVPEETNYMLVCTLYILIGLALTSTAIELVRGQYADSWEKVRQISSRLHHLSGPLAESIKKMGGNMMMGNLLMGSMMMGGNMLPGAAQNANAEMAKNNAALLQDLNELTNALELNSKSTPLSRGSSRLWKRFLEKPDQFGIDLEESHEPEYIQIIIYESSV